MKVKKGQAGSVTQPLLKDLIDRRKVQTKNTLNNMTTVTSTSLKQPDLYQDAGGGYNTKFVFPQE